MNHLMKCGVVGVVSLLCATSCSDDHFDILNGSQSSSQTIWKNIQDTKELSDFAEILQRTRIMSNSSDKKSTLTFAEYLDRPLSLTLWAPMDGTYDADAILAQLDELKELSDEEALAQEYRVVSQFVQNHLARFNYEGIRDNQEIRLLNSKVVNYNAAAGLFNNVPLAADYKAINSSNGTIHLLSGVSPFAYNIYEYLETADAFSLLVDSVLKTSEYDKYEFSAGSSTEGAMNGNGQMEYVDSVHISYNTLLNSSGAAVQNEDSTYLALIPSDACFEDALNKLRPLFNYGSSYSYDWSNENQSFSSSGSKALRFTSVEADSLRERNAKELLVKSMFFSPSIMSGVNREDSASIMSYALTADSLISTNRVIFYNTNPGGVNPMFDGQTPTRLSNGYVFALEHFNIDPAAAYVSKNEMTASYLSYSLCKIKGGSNQTVTLDDDNWYRYPIYDTIWNETIDEEGELIREVDHVDTLGVRGLLEDNKYVRFTVSGSQDFNFDFRLDNIYSGHYRIKAVMAPSRINNNYLNYLGEGVAEKAVFQVQLYDDEKETAFATSSDITVSQDSVDTYVLFDDVEIPKCYKGLPSGYSSFPRLSFRLPSAYQSGRKGRCKALNISKIIVEPIRENE